MVGFNFEKASLRDRYQAVYDIIQDIKNGKREHEQDDYHCGTAHCIAGWMEHDFILATEGVVSYVFDSVVYLDNGRPVPSYVSQAFDNADIDTWTWACRMLDLGNSGGHRLFAYELTIDKIEQNLLILAKEKGIEIKTGQNIRETIQPSSLWQQQLEGQRVSCGTSTN